MERIAGRLDGLDESPNSDTDNRLSLLSFSLYFELGTKIKV